MLKKICKPTLIAQLMQKPFNKKIIIPMKFVIVVHILWVNSYFCRFKMAGIKIFELGNLLFKRAFPLYRLIYPLYKRINEKKEIAFLKRNITKGDIVLDIGANIGFYSQIISNLVGSNGHVYCFEPDDLNFKRLSNELNGLVNTTCINKAVSENDNPIKIYVSPSLNVDHRTYPVEDYEKIIEISATCIDNFLNDKTNPHFIKMDIQGFEVSALKGMSETLQNTKGLKLFMEFWPYGLRAAGTGVEGLIKELKQYNIEVYTIEGSIEKLIELDSLLKFANWEWGQDLNLFIVFK